MLLNRSYAISSFCLILTIEREDDCLDRFTIQELNLICIYDTGTLAGLIATIREMASQLTEEEQELKSLSDSVLFKLSRMTDEEYAALIRNAEFTFDEEDEHGG